MAPPEMQQLELDMIEGMYETYKLISEDTPVQFIVLLSASPEDPPELQVSVTFPEEYPECAPCVITSESISKRRRVQVSTINAEVSQMVEENLGVHTVVMALQHLQDYLLRSAEEEEKVELVRRGEAQEAAAIAQKGPIQADPSIRFGIAVTRELFAEWSHKRAMQRLKDAQELAKKEGKSAAASKLSGRQLWDNTVASADWELFGEEDEGDGGEGLDFDTFGDGEEEYDLEDA